jgi:diguanylate cyclase (GGDEF)-like protein
MDGFEFRKRMLKEYSRRDIPFIFITARTDSINQVKGFKLQVEDYLTKPFDPVVLVARIESVLERRAAYLERMRLDRLSGLLTKESLETYLRKEFSRIVRYGGKGSLVLVCVKNFFQIRETFGYSRGDLLLMKFGQKIRDTIRLSDYAGRHDGGEFVIFLTETSKDLASLVIKRLVRILEDTPIGDADLRCDVSAVVAAVPEKGKNYNTVLKELAETMKTMKKENRKGITVL